jgi:23S rRNA (cytosine1962-C5)-methyltransferase
MEKEIVIKAKGKFVDKYKKGYPLISKDAIANVKDLENEGEIFKLITEKNEFIAKGYLGKQNKGYGWCLTSNPNDRIDASLFERRINSAVKNREKLYNDKKTNAFRVFNGEGDGIGGFTIENFNGYYLIQWYSEGIYKYKKFVVNTLKKLPDMKGIYQKKRFDDSGKYIEDDDFVFGNRAEFPLMVKENDVNFAIYLNEGAMVGVFLDQRDVRRTIKNKYAKGKSVLNTFSYTGAFSVFAALGGAKKTTSVDLASRSLPKTIENFAINGIDYDAHGIIVEDVFHYFKYAVKKELKFDIVILDPPSFAKSKKFKFSAASDYKNLMKQAITITEKEGIIVASTNCSSFDMKKFKTFIDGAFVESEKKYKIVEEFALPSDFRVSPKFKQGNYLKVLFVKVIG